ncbi:hypothetical protein F4801DRAFT_565063 [Xylaria longipes]|nr:hypothetical protein F4801DRAFT_565063 [Xylaria longipes]
MATTDKKQEREEQEGSRPRYEVEYHITSDRDDDAVFKVRRNAKAFYIRVFPSQFVNSPVTTKKYLSYLEVLRSGEEVIDDIFDTDVLDWATRPFEPFFAELAPSPALPPGQEDIRVTLRDYIEPEWFIFNLDVVDEVLQPRRVEMESSPYMGSSRTWLEDDFLDDLETWTALYDPANIVLSFEDPEDALFKPPRKVLIDNEKTACFFKPCNSPETTMAELNAYKKIAAAGLASRLRVCHLYGVVMNDNGFVVGMLLTYVDGRSMSFQVDPTYPSASVKKRWADQLDYTLAELHKAGVVWGDVKAENVLVDQDDNVWIIDFGGGYTRGWVDKKIAGTVEGDLAGMAKIKEFIFMREDQVHLWVGNGAASAT